MRIGFFTSIDGWGGSEMYLKTLILSLRQEGHDPVLIGVEGSRLFGELKAEGVECVAWKKTQDRGSEARGCLPPQSSDSPISRPAVSVCASKRVKTIVLRLSPGWVKLLAGNIREVVRLQRIISGLKFDIMQVTVHGYEVAGFASRLCGVPTLAVYQTSPSAESSFFSRLLIRWSTLPYQLVCFVSHFSANEWRKVIHIKRLRCVVIPNGANLDVYKGQRRGCSLGEKKTFRLISIGRLHPMKGYRYLIEALAILNDPAVLLEILGEGEDDVELRELARRLGVESSIHFCGHVQNPAEYLKMADCFVLASVSHEGSPFVLAEAMAVGMPLITSDYGPLPEINIHNETGLVVPARDSRALAGAIRLLRGNSNLVGRMGTAGCKRAIQYDQRQMVVKMLGAYKQVSSLQ
jgi:glycosyltransferase involved in cell wall biosynthesis